MQISSVRHPDSCCALCSMEHLLWQAGEEMGALGISDSHLITIDKAGCLFLAVEGLSSFPFSVRICAVLILGRKGVNWDANS